MNLAPLLAELAGLRALPNGLLQPPQQARLETVRSALALAQHIVPDARDDLPRIRISTAQGVKEGRVIGGCPGTLQLRLGGVNDPLEGTVALLHFTDGRPPRAIRGDLRRGPAADYWRFEATDGSLEDASEIYEVETRREVTPVVALAL